MGIYINPPDSTFGKMSKSGWLHHHFNIVKDMWPITEKEFKSTNFDTLEAEDKLIIVVIDNLDSIAILLCINEKELTYIQRICNNDPREMYYLVTTKETALEFAK